MVTLKPRDFRSKPREAETMPFPKDEVTPPVTKMYLVFFLLIRLGFGKVNGKNDMSQFLITLKKKTMNEKLKEFLKYEELLKHEISKIFELKNNNFTKELHYIISITNRSIHLNRGFYNLIISENYFTALSIIRLQLDNCMRLYAMSLVEDSNTFYDDIFQGKKISAIKDKDKNPLKDYYLKEKLELIFYGFKNFYDDMSGFIHFSDKHFIANTKIINRKEDKFTLRISVGEKEEMKNDEIEMIIENMLTASNYLYKIICSYTLSLK